VVAEIVKEAARYVTAARSGVQKRNKLPKKILMRYGSWLLICDRLVCLPAYVRKKGMMTTEEGSIPPSCGEARWILPTVAEQTAVRRHGG
jgi:hypothetical protein